MLVSNVLSYHRFLAACPAGLGLPEQGFLSWSLVLRTLPVPRVASGQVGVMNSCSPRAGRAWASAEDPGHAGDVPELRGDAGEHRARPGHDPGPGGHAR